MLNLKKRFLYLFIFIFTIFSYSKDFKNNENYTNSINFVRNIMLNEAYDKKTLDDKLGNDIVDKLLEDMDYNKMFMNKSELSEVFEIKKDYARLNGDFFMQAGFLIYDRYLENVEYYYNYAINLVKENNFDFSAKENIKFGRDEGEFAENKKELKEIWRKKVKNDFLRLKMDGKKDNEIIDILTKRYDSNKKSILKLKQDDVAQNIINSFSESVDPHSTYYTPENAKEFLEDFGLSLVGMGAVIERRGDVNIIKELIKGGPAEKSGLFNVGDIFISVGQGKNGEMEDIKHVTLKELVKKIRGEKGSLVRIGVARTENSPVRIIPIIREEINLEDKRVKSNIHKINNKDVLYIKVPSFYSKTPDKKGHNVSDDFLNELKKAKSKKTNSIVIDLRDNGGGSLREVIKMIGYLVGKDKTAVQVLSNDGSVSKYKTDTDIVTKLPVVVMINRYSASASEIFAGAIKDYNRGIVVGSNSWGKGTVQTLKDLSDGSMIKITNQMFFRVNGSSTQLLGVTPDITFHEYYSKKIGEKKYKNAIKWRSVKNEVDYDFGAKNNFSEIVKNFKERIKKDNAWKIYMEEKQYVFENSEKEEYTLNLKERLDERNKQNQKRNHFIKEFRKNRLSTVNIFELDNGLASNEEDLKKALKKKEERENLVDEEMKEAMRISTEMKEIK